MNTYYFSDTQKGYTVLVMDFLAYNLEELFIQCKKKFSIHTVGMLADQIISRIEYLHSKNYIHRDVKPENFLIGLGSKSNIVHIIDFGMSKKYRDKKSHQHIPYREKKELTGTPRYASISAHLGIEQSRRDDLESVGYILIYFALGKLPWQGNNQGTKSERVRKISERKLITSIEKLCKDLPEEFANYLYYCRSLKFEERPDYVSLKKLFKDMIIRSNLEYDNVYDWTQADNVMFLSDYYSAQKYARIFTHQ